MNFPLSPKTIQARLVLSHLVVSLVSIALISVYAGNVMLRAVRQEVEHNYEDRAFAVVNRLEEPLLRLLSGEDAAAEVQAVIEQAFGADSDIHYTLFMPGGYPVIDSEGNLPPTANRESDPEVWEALESPLGEGEDFRRGPAGDETYYLAVRIEHDNRVFGILRLEVPLQVVLDASRQSLGLLISTALLVALGMGAVGYFLSRSLADPIKNLTTTAEYLARGELGARVDAETGLHEVQQMAHSFNEMASRLEDHVEQLRSFVANASHELRTPLTSIKLRVEALRNGALEDPPVTEQFLSEIESEVDRLVRMVNDLLDLSRIEAGLEENSWTRVDLGTVIREVNETFAARAERAGLELSYQINTAYQLVLGNEDQLRRMLTNLVDNAIKYTNPGGNVSLFLEDSEQPDLIVLRVTDTGFGIPAVHLPHVFERFYRAEATRPRHGPPQGSGLGLSIAKSIAEIHGGRIGVISQVGKGSTFWVELPAYSEN